MISENAFMVTWHDLPTFILLVGLELVLGIDNVLLISILTSRIHEAQRQMARIIGLGVALGLRIILLFGVQWVQSLRTSFMFGLTGRDCILVAGGLFLIYKAVGEMHHVIEREARAHDGTMAKPLDTAAAAIVQIALLDLVFSVDSVVTAVGLTDHLLVIIAAVIGAFVIVLLFAQQVAVFVERYPSLKVLALAFLVCIGVTIFIEGMHYEVPKAYIYLPMGFALLVEILNLRYDANRRRGVR